MRPFTPCAAAMVAGFAFAFFSPLPCAAQELATPAEAEAMFDEAMAYIDEHGLDAAREAFNDPDGEFIYKDLYVFCIDYDGIRTAFGPNPAHTGRNVIDLRDREGRAIVAEIIEVVQDGERHIYQYTWPNPVTNRIGPKYSYVQAVSSDEFCGVGYYE